MEDDERTIKPTVNRGRRMDFAPRNARATAVPYRRKSPEEMTEVEKARRERARKEVARREEIHRQIEAQKEADIIARRRAIAARKDLARRLEVEEKENAEALAEHERELREAQERKERAQRKALIEQRALRERQRLLAERRAKAAREELLRRKQEEGELRVPVKHIKRAVGSTYPLLEEDEKRAFFKRTRVAQRLGSVEDFESELNDLETAAEEVLEEKEDENIKEFVEDRKEDDLFDDIDRLDEEMEKKEEDASENNSRSSVAARHLLILKLKNARFQEAQNLCNLPLQPLASLMEKSRAVAASSHTTNLCRTKTSTPALLQKRRRTAKMFQRWLLEIPRKERISPLLSQLFSLSHSAQ